MSYNYTLKYRTFDQLMADIHTDFRTYSLENLIDPQQQLRVVRKCNYDLGLRIYQTKETLLEIHRGKVRLPDDFFTFNYGMLCANKTVQQVLPQGTNIQEVPVGSITNSSCGIPTYREIPGNIPLCHDGTICNTCNLEPCGCSITSCDGAPTSSTADICTKPRLFVNCKGECFELIQKVGTRTITYSALLPLRMIDNAMSIDCGCPNLYMRCADEIWIKDGFLYSNFDCGTVYVSYQGLLEDDQGNIMVPDHEGLNEFYEYRVKERVLENLMFEGEDVVNKLAYVQGKLRVAEREAKRIVLTPNFSEMNELFWQNRRAQYAKYFRMFQGRPFFYGTNGYWNR